MSHRSCHHTVAKIFFQFKKLTKIAVPNTISVKEQIVNFIKDIEKTDIVKIQSLKEYRISDIYQSGYKTVDINTLVTDSVDLFLNPYVSSILVTDEDDAIRSLSLKDLLKKISNNEMNLSIRHIINRNLVPLDYNAKVFDVFLDIVNSGSLLNPVYRDIKIIGILESEHLFDLLRIDSLFNAFSYFLEFDGAGIVEGKNVLVGLGATSISGEKYT